MSKNVADAAGAFDLVTGYGDVETDLVSRLDEPFLVRLALFQSHLRLLGQPVGIFDASGDRDRLRRLPLQEAGRVMSMPCFVRGLSFGFGGALPPPISSSSPGAASAPPSVYRPWRGRHRISHTPWQAGSWGSARPAHSSSRVTVRCWCSVITPPLNLPGPEPANR